MRRLISILLMLCLLAPCAAFAQEEQPAGKHDSWPEIFKVEYKTSDRKEDNNRYYVYKEYLITTNETVNEEIRSIVDDYDAQLFPQMQPDGDKNAKRNSRLDIEVIHYFTGDSWVSTLTEARISYKRQQVSCDFTTRTYDLESGERILLTDIFPEDSPAWDLLAQRVQEHLSGLFPEDPRNPEAIEQLCSREALENVDFTLSGMELTLHYQAKTVYPDRPVMMHVRFFYDELWDYMTPEARIQTDNTDYKMVAITCDDGPSYGPTNNTLVNYRHYGARVTYFTVGTRVNGNPDILMRQFDQNHIIASHSYDHWSGYTLDNPGMRAQLNKHNELLISLVGEPVTMFRAPGGTYPPWVEAEIGVPIIQWSVDSYDYTGKSAKRIFYSIRNNTIDGDIILLHDSGKIMYKAIPIYADWLRKNGFMMVTVEELARINGIIMQPNVVYHKLFEGDWSKRNDSNI